MEGAPESRRVLYAEGGSVLREDTASVLADDRIEIEAVATVDAAADVLDGEAHVDAVLTGTTLADSDWRDLATAVRDRDEHRPVILLADEGDSVGPNQATTAAGITEFLTRDSGDDGGLSSVRESILAAAEDYEEYRRLREQSDRYEQLMETLPHSIYFKDAQCRYVDVSESFRQGLDVDPIGKTDVDIWGERDGEVGEGTQWDDRRIVETGEAIVDEVEYHDTVDGDAWLQTTKFPRRDESGDIVGVVGLTQEVTEHKEREAELLRKSQRLEQFASFVSHDLRNPINIAQGYMDIAVETGDEEALERVDDALERMDTLVDDLLATVRDGEQSREWIDFPAFVQRVWTATETENVALEVDVPDGTRITAVGGQFRQLLNNLFRNADEHGSPTAGGAACENVAPDGATCTVTVGLTEVGFYVEDDGPGIDPERRDEVFEYGHSSGGTGIGLAIVDEIADSHGWEVTLTESEDGGARFEFEDCLVRREEFETVEEADPIQLAADADVGGATPPGRYEHDGGDGRVTVVAGGGDLWNDVEEHYIVYGGVDGNARIVAKLVDLQHVHEFSKAGLVVRDRIDTGSPLAYVGATPQHGPEVIARAFPRDPIETTQFTDLDAVPRWYRLDWIDSTVTLQTSPDGVDWTTLGSRAIAGRNPVTIGLLGCSHDEPQTCEAVFEHVRAVRLEPGVGDA